jgi:hypothetical protein
MRTEVAVNWHCPSCETIFGGYVEAFITSFGMQEKLDMPIMSLSGRILRGRSSEDFLTLTDNLERKVVFLLDSVALSGLVGLDGREVLRRFGYAEAFIVSLLAKGTQFKLHVLPEVAVKLAA